MQIQLDAEGLQALRPLVHAIVAQVLADLGETNGHGSRLAYTEREAAALLGLTGRQLAEQRRAGRVGYSRGPKNTILYSRSDLLAYLASRREDVRA
jgi:hypothetical protein